VNEDIDDKSYDKGYMDAVRHEKQRILTLLAQRKEEVNNLWLLHKKTDSFEDMIVCDAIKEEISNLEEAIKGDKN
jgi:hypothetical protein